MTGSSNKTVHVLQPSTGWSELGLRQVWEYRELLWFHILRNIKAKYRQTALGWLWILLNPLTSMVLFSVLFGKIAKLPSDGIPYPVFTYTAILPWTYFSTATQAATTSLSSQMGVISKVYFPRLLVPISAVFSALTDFAFSFVVLCGMIIWFTLSPAYEFSVVVSWSLLALPAYLLMTAASALAIGLWCAALQVRFHDVSSVIALGLRAWMYMTPVAYSASLIPERWKFVYRMNPLYWGVEGFRWALLGTGEGPGRAMIGPVVVIALMLVSGLYIFRRTEKNIVDLL